jgi:hypothetical protein
MRGVRHRSCYSCKAILPSAFTSWQVDNARIAAPLESWRDSDFPVSFTAEAFLPRLRGCSRARNGRPDTLVPQPPSEARLANCD